jgi:hypothetical protein
MDSELPVASAAEAWHEDGSLRDPEIADRLSGQLAELIAAVEREVVAAAIRSSARTGVELLP